MKREGYVAVTILCCGFLGNPSIAAHPHASDPNIIPEGQQVLDYLNDLAGAPPGHGELAGQWVSGPAVPNAYSSFYEKLHDETGHWPALLGSDYIIRGISKTPRTTPPDPPPELADLLTKRLIDQWKGGGLVSLTFQSDNPWYRLGGGVPCDQVPKPCVPGSLNDLLNTNNPAGAYFKVSLDRMADHLKKLQDAGVVVLFRPFNEMNGSWFWWGAQSTSSPSRDEFRRFWVYVHDYVTDQRGIHNLLWIFAPNNSELELEVFAHDAGLIQPAPYYYPGDAYVDIIGVSYYEDHLAPPPAGRTKGARAFSIPTYQELIAHGKPFGFAELGPSSKDKRQFSFIEIVHEAARDYPKAVFFQAWQDHPENNTYLSILANRDPNRVMMDPLVITRERLAVPGHAAVN